jgi:pyruvate kinase
MSLYEIKQGRVIRQEVDEHRRRHELPLNTKIVATIGSPTSYGKGPFTLEDRRVERLSYDYLVGEFFNNGVDVIRLNLSHLEKDSIASTFKLIKRAILNCERKNGKRKRIALLADLEGPKIRFVFKQNLDIKVGQKFMVNFDGNARRRNEETVKVDEKSLKDALSTAEGDHVTFIPANHEPFDYEEEGIKVSALVENALGGRFRLPSEFSTPFQRMIDQIKTRAKTETVLAIIGDGDVIMKVEEPERLSDESPSMSCRVITVKRGRFNKNEHHPGFTIKGIDFDVPSFTDSDKAKLDKLLEADYKEAGKEGWEPVLAFIGLSFTQTADDVLRIKEYIESRLKERMRKVTKPFLQEEGDTRLHSPMIIAKIETSKGRDNKHYILDVADGIMVARGDLGLQTDIEEVPAVQKKLIRLCNKRGKPVITATEMLKSMTESIEPTRAEGTDVFNAILDGSDAVMLSEETSSGERPFNAIRKMLSIAVHAERYYERRDMKKDFRRRENLHRYREFLNDDFERIDRNTRRFKRIENVLDEAEVYIRNSHLDESEKVRMRRSLMWRKALYIEKWEKSIKQRDTNRITEAACSMCEGEDIKCILAPSTTGRTVRMISRLRPSVLIVGAAHDPLNSRKLAVSYGVLTMCIAEIEKKKGIQGIFENFQREVILDSYVMNRLLRRGDTIIFTAGTPLKKPGTTNSIQMRKIE